MAVFNPSIPATPDEKNDWLQSLRRVLRALPIAERQRAIQLLQSDLKEAHSSAFSREPQKLPADHPAWDVLDRFIQEDREAERAALDAVTVTAEVSSDKP